MATTPSITGSAPAAPPVDYDALANQARASSGNAAAPATGSVDYDALANQARGVSGANSDLAKTIGMARKDSVPDDETLDYIGKFKPELADSIQQAKTSGKTSSQILDQFAGVPAPEAPSVGGFLKNVVSSGANLAVNTAHAVRHPIDTLSDVASEGAGLAKEYVPGYEAFGKATGDSDALTAHDKAMADALKQNLADRYGSLSQLGHTLYTDPVGTVADLSAVAGGAGSVARGAGSLADIAGAADAAAGASKVAQAASTVADVTNPVGLASKVAGKGIDLAKFGTGKLIEKALASPDVNKLPQAAVDMAQDANIPLNQGAITGSRAVLAAEKTLGETIAPDKYAELLDSQQKGLNAKAQDLSGPEERSPYQAGQEVLDHIDAKLQETHQLGQDAYAKFDAESADPANTRPVTQGAPKQVVTRAANGSVTNVSTVPNTSDVALPVNVATAKQMLQPVYSRISESLKAVPEARRLSDPGYRVLARLMEGPDTIAASHAEEILGLLKGIGREAIMPEVKTRSQGIAAIGVKVLQPAIDKALENSSMNAAEALHNGRTLWAEKEALADLKEKLGGADQSHQVSAFKKLTAPQDANFDTLRKVLDTAPEAAQSLRRGYLTNLFEKPMENGGFQNADKALAEWRKLGPQTKAAIFEPGQAGNIDTFLKLAKRIGENPNPSGTGTVNALLKFGLLVAHPGTGVPALFFGRKLASVLYTADGAKNLAALMVAGPASKMGQRAVAALSAADVIVENRQRGRMALQARLTGKAQ